MKGRETFYRRHTVPVTSCSEVKYVLKRVWKQSLKFNVYSTVINLIHLVLPVHYASSCHVAFSRIQSVVNVFIVLSQVKSTVQQFDNLIHLVLPVHYDSLCHAAFSRIQSDDNVFIVLSQVFICFKVYSSTV